MNRALLKIILICFVFSFVACNKETEQTKVIPADVDYVASFDCEAILTQIGAHSSFTGTHPNHLLDLSSSNQNNSLNFIVTNIVSQSSETGIDWSEKMFSFRPSGSSLVTLLLPIKDAIQFKKFLLELANMNKFSGAITEAPLFSWVSISNLHIAFTDKVCFVILNDLLQSEDELNAKVSNWLTLEREQSFVSTQYYSQLIHLDGEIGIYSLLNHLPENLSLLASLVSSEDADLSSLRYLANISLEAGKIVAEGQLLFEDTNLRDSFSQIEKSCTTLNGKSLAYLPKQTPLWFAIGLDGDQLFEQLSEHPSYKHQMNNSVLPLDFESLIRSVDGDVSVSYPNGLFIDVKNDELLKVFVHGIQTMGRFIGLDLEQVDNKQYQLVDDNHRIAKWLGMDIDLNMGMIDQSFYVQTTQVGEKLLTKDQSLVSAPWAREVNGNKLFLALNIQESIKLFDKYVSSETEGQLLQHYFDYFTYGQKRLEQNVIELSFVDKQRSVLEQLLELYVKLQDNN